MDDLSRRGFLEFAGLAAVGSLSLAQQPLPVAASPFSGPGTAASPKRRPERLIDLSAGELAARIRSREVSSEEAVRTHLERIERINPVLNALVFSNEQALDEARAADRALARGVWAGPLHGVPITVKDSHDVAGLVSTAGTQGREQHVPAKTATAVRRLQEAGAIVLGKTNTPEITLSFDTVNELHGRTWNPYDLTRSPGGSSGGAAALIAASGSPLDLGTDTGGSIRLPAHFCGIAGLKPTSGRVPRTGHVISFDGLHQSLTQVGPLARFVDDLALLLPLIAGPDGVDPHVAPVPVQDPAAVDVASLRVAYHEDNFIATPEPVIRNCVRQAAQVIEDAGARVAEAVPPGLRAYHDASDALWMADGGAWVRRILSATGTTQPSEQMARELRNAPNPPLSASELTRLLEVRDRFRSTALAFWEDHDVLLCPVNAHTALMPDESHELLPAFTYTYLYNDLGWPGAVVRCGATEEGLPIGVQVLAAPWREDRCLAVARLLERELGGWQPIDESLIV